jgi:nondiscriminating aspartyl-tRNA synthetase
MSASSSFPATTPVLRILARELPQHIGERVLLQGWLHHQRHLKAVDFLLLRDRSGISQVVIEEPDLRARLAALPHETVL